jgi:hypothetical protein
MQDSGSKKNDCGTKMPQTYGVELDRRFGTALIDAIRIISAGTLVGKR